MKRFLVLASVTFLLSGGSAFAENVPHIDKWAYPEKIRAGLERLTPRRNYIFLPRANVTLRVPGTFYYLDHRDSRWVYETAWFNPPEDGILGMIFPSKHNPYEPGSWGAIIQYAKVGFMPKEVFRAIDDQAFLEVLKANGAAQNKRRVEEGFDRIDIVGWEEKPYYYEPTNRFYFVTRLRREVHPYPFVNYDVLVPGREGVLVFTFIGEVSSLSEMKSSFKQVLAMTHFDEGYGYEDYQPGDRVVSASISDVLAGTYYIAPSPSFWIFAFFLVALVVLLALLVTKRRKRPISEDFE